MTDGRAPRARRVPVAAEEPLIGNDRYDYADAFEIRTGEQDPLSPLLGRGVLVGRRVDPMRAEFTTYLFYGRQAPARVVWMMVGPLHRRVAPYLLAASNEIGTTTREVNA